MPETTSITCRFRQATFTFAKMIVPKVQETINAIRKSLIRKQPIKNKPYNYLKVTKGKNTKSLMLNFVFFLFIKTN